MPSLFSGLFQRRRNRFSAMQFTPQLEDDDYPKNEGDSFASKDPVLASAPAVGGGSWRVHMDHEGRPFWWNNVTGQWTYQMYSATGLAAPPPPPPPTVMCATAGLSSPYLHQQWLGSPASAGVHGQANPWGSLVMPSIVQPATASKISYSNDSASGMGTVLEGAWEKCYNAKGEAVWIHSITGELTEQCPFEY